MTSPTSVAVVMACFNRRATTLRCLENLSNQKCDKLCLEVHLLDDASPDGTAQAVQSRFPDVNLLYGDGTLFWGGGMHRAMNAAIPQRADFILWLNDDVTLYPGAVEFLVQQHAALAAASPDTPLAVVGSLVDPSTGVTSYSGMKRLSRSHPAKLAMLIADGQQPVRCDTMNGNCVLLPRELTDIVGPIDDCYPQQIGDLDYGYRIAKAGGELWIAARPIGECTKNNKPRRWQDPSLGIFERVRMLNTPHGMPVLPWTIFMFRHAGIPGLFRLAVSYLRVLVMPAKALKSG